MVVLVVRLRERILEGGQLEEGAHFAQLSIFLAPARSSLIRRLVEEAERLLWPVGEVFVNVGEEKIAEDAPCTNAAPDALHVPHRNIAFAHGLLGRLESSDDVCGCLRLL